MRILFAFATIWSVHADGAGQCMQAAEGDESFVMDLPYDGHPPNVTVPGIPTSVSAYAYATENALVAIPEACYEAHGEKITKSKELNDRQPGGPTGMRYFYISDLEGGFASLKAMTDCACGLVVEMHGSGGPGWTAVMFAAWFSGMGLIQVIPNSMAMPDELSLKGKLPMKDIADITTDNYCGGFSAFEGSCGSFSKPYCYSTKEENVLANGQAYRKYVEGVYEIRRRELKYFVADQADLLFAFSGKVYLVGNSEGSMVASRFHHPTLDSVMAGRILTAYACDYNYFVSCEESSKVCEDACDKDVPQLNVIGSEDEYFGNQAGSMSFQVKNGVGGYGGDLTGNCRAKYNSQGFTKATVVEFEGAGHGPSYWNDNRMRSIFADFMQKKGKGASSWDSLDGCTATDGVFTCPIGDASPCMPGWALNPDATWSPSSVYTCTPVDDDTKDNKGKEDGKDKNGKDKNGKDKMGNKNRRNKNGKDKKRDGKKGNDKDDKEGKDKTKGKDKTEGKDKQEGKDKKGGNDKKGNDKDAKRAKDKKEDKNDGKDEKGKDGNEMKGKDGKDRKGGKDAQKGKGGMTDGNDAKNDDKAKKDKQKGRDKNKGSKGNNNGKQGNDGKKGKDVKKGSNKGRKLQDALTYV